MLSVFGHLRFKRNNTQTAVTNIRNIKRIVQLTIISNLMFRVLQRTSSEVTVNIPLSLILLISKWQACFWPQTKQELNCNLAGVSTAAFGCNALRMQLFKKPLHSQCSSCTEKKRLAWGVTPNGTESNINYGIFHSDLLRREV